MAEEIRFSEILKERLKGKNLTAIAREIGIPKTLIHDWVQARRLPSFKNVGYVKKLADYLGLTLEELLLGTPQKNIDVSIENKIITSITFKDEGRDYQINIIRL